VAYTLAVAWASRGFASASADARAVYARCSVRSTRCERRLVSSLMLLFGSARLEDRFGFLLGVYPVVLAVLAGVRQVSRELVLVARASAPGPAGVSDGDAASMLSTLTGGLRAGLALTVVGVIVARCSLRPGSATDHLRLRLLRTPITSPSCS